MYIDTPRHKHGELCITERAVMAALTEDTLNEGPVTVDVCGHPVTCIVRSKPSRISNEPYLRVDVCASPPFHSVLVLGHIVRLHRIKYPPPFINWNDDEWDE